MYVVHNNTRYLDIYLHNIYTIFAQYLREVDVRRPRQPRGAQLLLPGPRPAGGHRPHHGRQLLQLQPRRHEGGAAHHRSEYCYR